MKRLELKVRGKVQGVFYRQNTKKKAEELDIKGYVKNMRDGSVMIVAEGSEESLKQLLKWCWQGPKSAQVIDVETEWQTAKNEFTGFSVKY